LARTRVFLRTRTGLACLGAVGAIVLVGLCFVGYYYIRFSHLIDLHLSGAVFENTSHVYAAPEVIYAGETLHPTQLRDDLLRAGYAAGTQGDGNGWFRAEGFSVEIHPSEKSFFHGENALRVDFDAASITRITSLAGGAPAESAEIEPLLLTNLFDSSREKRRILKFNELPKPLVEAVLSVEDKRFFEHPGFDFVRIFGAAWADLHHGARSQGASTLDMQVARSFFFSNARTWRRKMAETLMALELEHRFTKQQIFELYANEIYLGNRGSFSIRGFGEASETYFGKDVRDLNLAETAFLAGIIHSPNRYSSPERHPQHAAAARDRALNAMLENHAVTAQQAATARIMPMHFTSPADTGAASYFVDMVRDKLLEDFSETDLTTQSYSIYTTLDPALQRAAGDAISAGMKQVDQLLAKKYERWRKSGEAVPQVQVALIALDPTTGEIRALAGGRDYGESQLNHALARRQPGSSFKPFVYAAAFNTAINGQQPVITPLTTVVDEPTTFTFDGRDYTPNNYGEQFYGTVTVRDALIHSLNVATVKVAEMVGFDRVAQLAKEMNLGPHILGTPAVALGAYEMTPLEVAAGYTAFASDGTRAEPLFLREVVNTRSAVLEKTEIQRRAVLDPRVAYLVTSVMEDVLSRGTGFMVRRLGFTAPAAGKTGTSRDGWFAGFTSNLVCVVWIGFDDNRDLGLSGGASAAPLWAEFMKRAVLLPRYRNPKPFAPPEGIVQVTLGTQSGLLADSSCPDTRTEVFIDGTQPTQFCSSNGEPATEAGTSPTGGVPTSSGAFIPRPQPFAPLRPGGQPAAPGELNPDQPGDGQSVQAQKKKNLMQKIFGIFGGGNKKTPNTSPQPEPQPQ
jgi:penicillin-binding protein 1B